MFRAFILAAGGGPTSTAGCFVLVRDRPPAGPWGLGKGPRVPQPLHGGSQPWRRALSYTDTLIPKEPLP